MNGVLETTIIAFCFLVLLFLLSAWIFLMAGSPDYLDTMICNNVGVTEEKCAAWLGLQYTEYETVTTKTIRLPE